MSANNPLVSTAGADPAALEALYKQAWGRAWPSNTQTIDVPERTGPWEEAMPASTRSYTCLTDTSVVWTALALPSPPLASIVVLDEWDYLEKALTTDAELYFGRPDVSAIVTGHPGTGKSVWLVWLLLRRLEKQEPVAFQCHPHQYVMFDRHGLQIMEAETFLPSLQGAWALFDGSSKVVQPDEAFRNRARVVYACPPGPERWESWQAAWPAYRLVADLPSPAEIAAIAMALKRGNAAWALGLCSKWGPCIRTVVDVVTVPGGELEHANNVRNAAAAAAINPNMITSCSVNNAPSSTNSALVFLRPSRVGTRDEVASMRAVSGPWIPTSHLWGLFRESVGRLPTWQRLKPFQALSAHSLTRSGAGWDHKKRVHERLGLSGGELTIYDSDGTSRSLTSADEVLDGALDALGTVPPVGRVYWLPCATDLPGVDSMLCIDDHVYLIQATIAAPPDPAGEGIRNVWLRFDRNRRAEFTWHFVVVGDRRATATRAYDSLVRDLAELTTPKMTLWWAAIEPPRRLRDDGGFKRRKFDVLA